MKKSIPTYYAKDIFSVKVDFFLKEGIKVILFDLDNTLDPFNVKEPTQRVFALKKNLEDANIKMYIISNNRGKRVSHYSKVLDVPYLSRAGKPFAKRLKNYLKEENIDLNSALLCGDQLMTDIPCGNKAHIRTMLFDPISPLDQLSTKINRLFDRPKRKRYIKKGLIKYLEEDYGK